MNLEQRVALVTGASRGIGQAIARELGRRGATVVGTATSESGAAAISEYLAADGIRGRGLMLNVTDAAAIEAAVKAVTQEFGSLSILVNNAGITRDNLFMRMKDAEWDDILRINLTGAFRLARASLRGMMKKRWGRIVSITSVVGVTGNPGQGNYAAAKAGLIGMSKSLAAEVASRNITVNCVAPGFIATPMTGALTDEQKAQIAARIPAGRMGTPEEIAAAVVYLASEEAAYVTGATIHVNGGMAMV